jgi:hypothetical protein
MTDTKAIAAELQIAERYFEVHYSRHAAVAGSENGCAICADIQEYIWLRRTALSVAGILSEAKRQPLTFMTAGAAR